MATLAINQGIVISAALTTSDASINIWISLKLSTLDNAPRRARTFLLSTSKLLDKMKYKINPTLMPNIPVSGSKLRFSATTALKFEYPIWQPLNSLPNQIQRTC